MENPGDMNLDRAHRRGRYKIHTQEAFEPRNNRETGWASPGRTHLPSSLMTSTDTEWYFFKNKLLQLLLNHPPIFLLVGINSVTQTNHKTSINYGLCLSLWASLPVTTSPFSVWILRRDSLETHSWPESLLEVQSWPIWWASGGNVLVRLSAGKLPTASKGSSVVLTEMDRLQLTEQDLRVNCSDKLSYILPKKRRIVFSSYS